MALVILFVLLPLYHSTLLELTNLDLDHTGCNMNIRFRETVFLAAAIAANLAREVKAADMNNPQAAIY